MKRKYFNNCIECNKKVTHNCKSGLCKSCSHKGNRAYSYKDGHSCRYRKCSECGKELSRHACKGRCKACSLKMQVGTNNPNYHNGKKIEGKRNPNWLGGISFIDYPKIFTDKLKLSIRQRDNYKCSNCGMNEGKHLRKYGAVLVIHHIDYNKHNCKKSNLITLCRKCNLQANWNRNYWKLFYKVIIILKKKKIL
jgi:hypothetical protein